MQTTAPASTQGLDRLEAAIDRTEGMISMQEAELLYRAARACKNGCIVEVGSYRGRSTVALAMGSEDGAQAPVFAIDPHETFTGTLGGEFGPQDRAAFFRAMLDTDCYRSVRLINLSSEQIAPGWTQPIGVLWIDGDHRYEGVKRDFDAWVWRLTEDAIVLFDDATDTSIGPYRLIQELLATGRWIAVADVGKIVALRRA